MAKKITVSKSEYLTLKEVEEKFASGETYEADGASIKKAAKGLFEAGKLRGWLYGASAMGIAWLAVSILNDVEEEFKADKG